MSVRHSRFQIAVMPLCLCACYLILVVAAILQPPMRGPMIAVAGGRTTSPPSIDDAPAAALSTYAPTKDYFVRDCGLISFNGMTRTARWTLERINSKTASRDRTGESFHNDPDVPHEFAPVSASYAQSGFDIGHQIPFADHGETAAAGHSTETFANACPQWPGLNRGPWKTLEARLRTSAQAFGVREIQIVTAPAWLPTLRNGYRFEAIGSEEQDHKKNVLADHRVWIPTHCLKSAATFRTDDKILIESWRLPNVEDLGDVTLDDFKITTDEFEANVGLDVWRGIKGEKELEAAK